MAFIDVHRQTYGVEPICAEVPIAPSTYYAHKAKQADPARRSNRAKRDEILCERIERTWHEHFCNYGRRKMCKQVRRDGTLVARCTVERLMRRLGLCGAVRGKRSRSTTPSTTALLAPDRVDRRFTASKPNEFWVADLTYVSTWRGFAFGALVIDAFARKIVGWRVSSSLATDLVLDALEQAIYARRQTLDGLIHHSDRGTQYLSIHYTGRLAEAGISPSVGSVGDSYDNALAESIIGLYKTEVIRKQRSWRSVEVVEWATLRWVDW